MIGLLLREALDRLRVRLNMYLVFIQTSYNKRIMKETIGLQATAMSVIHNHNAVLLSLNA